MKTNSNNINNVKLVLLANIQNDKIIGEYNSKSDSSFSSKAEKIFKEYKEKTNTSNNNNNIKLPSEEGVFYCKISHKNIFYLALVNEKFPERQVFDLIDELIKDNIHLLIDSKGVLNHPGRKALKDLVMEYDQNLDQDKLSTLNGDIQEIKIEMKNNVKKALANTDDLNTLDVKAVRIKDNADIFKKDAINLKRKTYFQNLKWKIVFVLLIIVLGSIFVVPMLFNDTDKKVSEANVNNDYTQDSNSKLLANHTNSLFLNY